MWGWNSLGQLGDGTTTDRDTPIEITSNFDLKPGETIVSVSLGRNHSSVMTSSGRDFMWGRNGSGQLGDGTTTDIEAPIEITSNFDLKPGETLVSVTLGNDHSSAMTSSGRVFMWGRNNSGQLGDGTTTDRFTPVEIPSNSADSKDETLHLYGDLLEKPTPTREGYTFDGWYVDTSFTTQYTFSTMPSENLNLIGRWIPND